jgi:hypothetical protein
MKFLSQFLQLLKQEELPETAEWKEVTNICYEIVTKNINSEDDKEVAKEILYELYGKSLHKEFWHAEALEFVETTALLTLSRQERIKNAADSLAWLAYEFKLSFMEFRVSGSCSFQLLFQCFRTFPYALMYIWPVVSQCRVPIEQQALYEKFIKLFLAQCYKEIRWFDAKKLSPLKAQFKTDEEKKIYKLFTDYFLFLFFVFGHFRIGIV